MHLIIPLVTNGLSHPYPLDESIFIFRGFRSKFSFLFHFSMKIMSANRIAPDGTPHFAVTHLGLICLSMSHKKDTGLYGLRLIKMRSKPLNPCLKFDSVNLLFISQNIPADFKVSKTKL